MGTARWTYNKMVEFATKNPKVACSKKNLRAYKLNKDTFSAEEWEWVKETPYDIRDEAMIDFVKARKAAWEKHKKTKVKGEELKPPKYKFRSRNDPTQCISVLKKHWGRERGHFYPIFNKDKLKCEAELPSKLPCDSRLIKTRLGEYYLCIPEEITSHPTINTTERVLSVDPGVRTFMTGYDIGGNIHEWGDHRSRSRLCKLGILLDKLQSKISQCKDRRQKSRLKKGLRRGHRKIRNMVDDMHRKLAKWMCENFSIILLPDFKVKSMVSKKLGRKISSKTVRSMCTWSHYRFKQYLNHKSREFQGVKVVEVTEEWTSKTCSCCGKVDDKLGGKKVYKCKECGNHMDRDANGAKNILVKYLTEKNISLY